MEKTKSVVKPVAHVQVCMYVQYCLVGNFCGLYISWF